MVKLIALYRQPTDPAKFDEHYFNVHVPLTARIPGLRDMKVTRIVGSPAGKSEFYLLCEMLYDSHEALKAALRTDEARASAKDVMAFAGDLVTMMIGEEVDGKSV